MIISLIKSFYPYFAIFAIIGITLRIKSREWTMPETILLTLWLGHNALTVFQVGCFGDEWNFSRRYLLPSAPLAFGWAAYALNNIKKNQLMCIVAIIFSGFLIFDAIRPGIECYWKKGKKTERILIKEFSHIIANDWQGNNFYQPDLWWDEYRSPKRPFVQCEDSPAVGYYAGGRSVHAESTEHLSPDYIISSIPDPIAGYSVLKKVNIDGVYYILRKKTWLTGLVHLF